MSKYTFFKPINLSNFELFKDESIDHVKRDTLRRPLYNKMFYEGNRIKSFPCLLQVAQKNEKIGELLFKTFHQSGFAVSTRNWIFEHFNKTFDCHPEFDKSIHLYWKNNNLYLREEIVLTNLRNELGKFYYEDNSAKFKLSTTYEITENGVLNPEPRFEIIPYDHSFCEKYKIDNRNFLQRLIDFVKAAIGITLSDLNEQIEDTGQNQASKQRDAARDLKCSI